MRHRIEVYSDLPASWGRRLWYVYCKGCNWEPATRHEWPDGRELWARPNWDMAFALGIAHLREAGCKHERE